MQSIIPLQKSALISDIELGVRNVFFVKIILISWKFSFADKKFIIDVFFGGVSHVQCKHDITALLRRCLLSRLVGILRLFVQINLVSAVGKNVTRSRHIEQVDMALFIKSALARARCSNCYCCGSAQMVQQQLKLVTTVSGQLQVHLASYQSTKCKGILQQCKHSHQRTNPNPST